MTSYADFYRQSIDQPDAFWAEQARLIDWQQPFRGSTPEPPKIPSVR